MGASRGLVTTAATVAALAVTTALTGGAAPAAGASPSTASRTGAAAPAEPAAARHRSGSTAVGYGGAVASVDTEATRIGLAVLRRGGNAVDAAVATAAALGVTEPYSAGLGGGGYFVYYDASTGRVHALDGRETAPAGIEPDAFIDPETGDPYPFSPERVTSGVSVGVPGTPATWERALDLWGSWRLKSLLKPAARLAWRGFVVDETFRLQTAENQERFEAFTSTPPLFLPGGEPPEVGSVLRNPDLARTYRLLGRKGMRAFYTGPLAWQIARTVQDPPTSPDTDLPVPPGDMTVADLADYRTILREPTRVGYRGLDVYGMPPSSSGGSTVGEALNIMERFGLRRLGAVQALHYYLEATALAFADRGRYLGDPAYVDVPLAGLLSDRFAAERACLIAPGEALAKPVPPGDVDTADGVCDEAAEPVRADLDTENRETTNLTVVDRWGNVVEYTLTIEQTGGSGMVVPGRGFILNNELTDFSTVFDPEDPNRIQPGKRPRSSMSPTIVLRKGRPVLALGSPGGSTIITTVTQVLHNRIDRRMSLPRAVAAPRASQRNTTSVTAEQAFIDIYGAALEDYGHALVPAGDPGTSRAELGAATAIEVRRGGLLIAVAEPSRRGGGSAGVVWPLRRPGGR